MNTAQLTRVAVITGGSSGIGLATAELVAARGEAVVLVGRDEQRLAAAQRRVGASATAPVLTVVADVSTPAGVDELMSRVRDDVGRIDVLFANAGRSDAPPIEQTTEHDFDLMMNTNVKSVFFTVVRALPLLRPGASVVVTSSVAEAKGRPGDPLYAASKAAVRSLVRTLALDEAVLGRGIRVNAVTPGTIATPLTAQDDPGMQAAIDDYVATTVPLGRWGTAADVARAVLFLTSADAAYITGSEVVVDGGLAQT